MILHGRDATPSSVALRHTPEVENYILQVEQHILMMTIAPSVPLQAIHEMSTTQALTEVNAACLSEFEYKLSLLTDPLRDNLNKDCIGVADRVSWLPIATQFINLDQ